MLDLLVLRHAKSSWKDPNLEDHDRPLNKRGRKAAPRMGRLMVEESLVPDLLLCSTATRARETWRRLNEQAGWTLEERFVPALYPGDPDEILRCLGDLPEDYRCVLLVGHNPCMEGLVSLLTGSDVTLPTAALVHLRADGPWSSLPRAELVEVWLPRRLEDPS
jgi:phosphohistidine phosphatase